jgi:glycosyltransferase involved in cell wall biosynthesis
MDGFTIVNFAGSRWERYVKRPHVIALNSKCRTLNVDLPIALLEILYRPRIFVERLIAKYFPRGTAECEIFTPITIFPIALTSRLGLLRIIDSPIYLFQMTRYIKKRIGGKTVFLFHSPHYYYLIEKMKADLTIFLITDCIDSSIVEMGDKAISISDIVLFNSQEYMSTFGHLQNKYYIPNGADTAMFGGSYEEEADIKCIKRPRIMWAGRIRMLHYDWLAYAASNNPNWSFIMLGSIDSKTDASNKDLKLYKRNNNVHFLGWKDFTALPSYMNSADVLIMPYDESVDFVRFSHPNKIYQYLASGKPVVSSVFPEASKHGDVICLCETKENFEIQIKQALLNGGDDSMIAKRKNAAKNNDLGAIADLILAIVKRHLT